MKTEIKGIIVVAGFLAPCACSITQTNDIKNAEWLIGIWETKTASGSMFESWNKINDNEFSGQSFLVTDQEKIVLEIIQLIHKQDGSFYISTVENQNDCLPVRFFARSILETEMIFENPQHDFPQTISYIKITSNSLVAEISGTVQGEVHKQTFPMKHII